MVIHAEFKTHRLNEMGMDKAQEISEQFDNLLFNLENICPPGREFSLVRTKLEEASFYAKKSMAMLPVNQAETTGDASAET
jgi:hypothetical protein